MLSSWKTDLKISVNIWSLSILFKSRLLFELNLIFMKSHPYSPSLSSILSARLLIPYESSEHFFNTFFLSVEAKFSTYFQLFVNVSVYFTNNKIERIYIINIIISTNTICYYIFKTININTFVWLLVYF